VTTGTHPIASPTPSPTIAPPPAPAPPAVRSPRRPWSRPWSCSSPSPGHFCPACSPTSTRTTAATPPPCCRPASTTGSAPTRPVGTPSPASSTAPPNRSTAGTRAARGAVTSATVVSALVLLIAVSWALLPGLFTHFDPNDGGDTPALLPPSLDHWFGTDQTGRDAFTRVVYGASQS